MDREAYDALLARYVCWAGSEPDVLGLVAVGSTAGLAREPDPWSDHDLLVVARRGAGPRLRGDLARLPDAERVVLRAQETEGGLVLLDVDGHLVELAILEPDELDGVVLEDVRVLLDRGGVVALVEGVRSSVRVEAREAVAARALALFAKEVVVGVARHARGERLSGHQRVRVDAVRHLLDLAWSVREPYPNPAACAPDPFRRVERVMPQLAAEIEQAAHAPVPVCASALVALAERESAAVPGLADPELFRALRAVVIRRAAESAAGRPVPVGG